MSTLSLTNLIARMRSQFGSAFILLALALESFALPLTTRAAGGGLRNEDTAEGNQALNAIATNSANIGASNTAVGSFALFADTAGSLNTACGGRTLQENTIGGNNTALGGFALHANGSGNTTRPRVRGRLPATQCEEITRPPCCFVRQVYGDNNTAIGFEALLGKK